MARRGDREEMTGLGTVVVSDEVLAGYRGNVPCRSPIFRPEVMSMTFNRQP